MTATTTKTRSGSHSSVRAKARSATVVANELANMLLQITHSYGVSEGCLTNNLETILSGFRVWITAQQLKSVVLECFDNNEGFVRKWRLDLDYADNGIDEDKYESDIDALKAQLKSDAVKGIKRYRLLACHNTSDHVQVPGWESASLTDDSHLERKEVSSNGVRTKFHRVAVFVFGIFSGPGVAK